MAVQGLYVLGSTGCGTSPQPLQPVGTQQSMVQLSAQASWRLHKQAVTESWQLASTQADAAPHNTIGTPAAGQLHLLPMSSVKGVIEFRSTVTL
jgi:hypothetical protein